jgi:hypothetical protein
VRLPWGINSNSNDLICVTGRFSSEPVKNSVVKCFDKESLELEDETKVINASFGSLSQKNTWLVEKLDTVLVNGDVIKIAEENQTYSVSDYSSKNNYFNIHVQRLSSDGDVLWTKEIRKSQYGDISASFEVFLENNILYFFFNDHIDNENKSNTDKLKDYKYPLKNSAFMMMSLNIDDPILSKRQIITPLGLGKGVAFEVNCQLHNGKLLFKTSIGDNYGLLEVLLPE